jgi:hypothetical protein
MDFQTNRLESKETDMNNLLPGDLHGIVMDYVRWDGHFVCDKQKLHLWISLKFQVRLWTHQDGTLVAVHEEKSGDPFDETDFNHCFVFLSNRSNSSNSETESVPHVSIVQSILDTPLAGVCKEGMRLGGLASGVIHVWCYRDIFRVVSDFLKHKRCSIIGRTPSGELLKMEGGVPNIQLAFQHSGNDLIWRAIENRPKWGDRPRSIDEDTDSEEEEDWSSQMPQ